MLYSALGLFIGLGPVCNSCTVVLNLESVGEPAEGSLPMQSKDNSVVAV